eukprot:m.13199 g.13199  ORF g.13199 m.13199 type:complete len:371 (-) comp8330_c0_seq1:78-1190(-)
MAHVPLTVDEFHDYAKEHLPKQAYDYYASGANDEISLQENRTAFARYRLRPRILRNVSVLNTETTILGQKIATPICIAPTAMQRMAHPDGETATARAAQAAQTAMILSSWSTSSIEEVARSNGDGLRWFQLYVYHDRKVVLDLVHRAEASGYKALVVTVDTPILGQRNKDVKNRFKLPSHLTLANFSERGDEKATGVQSNEDSGLAAYVASLIDQTLNWEDIAWLKKKSKLPLVLKGILTAEDARLAVQHGASAVIVSNHGARQLDTCPATLEALPEVVKAVNGRAEVYLDGGIRMGTDVLKALALGARAVFIGRPVLWGLSYDGQAGVTEVLRVLQAEFRLAMALSGMRNLKEITSNLVAPVASFYSKL